MIASATYPIDTSRAKASVPPMPWTPTACPSLRPVPSRAETSPAQLMLRIRRLMMIGTDPAGVWGGNHPMPRHSAYALVYSIDCLIQSANRITPFNATQRVLCGAIQHPITASSTHPCDMSDAVSECLGISAVRKVNNPNRIKGLGGEYSSQPRNQPTGGRSRS